MELLNATSMQAGYTMGMRPDGRELLVVVAKGTFVIPSDGNEPYLAEQQVPLIMADEFHGEPGLSSVKYESDFAPYKPRCDLLLSGSAHAPGGKPATVVPVAMKVGTLKKSFNVVGDRRWLVQMDGFRASEPEPFVTMPISYGNAFGGTDTSSANPEEHGAYMENPVGVGFHCNLKREFVEGKSLPNCEEAGATVQKPDGTYRPMSFGCIGRNFRQRIGFAGTYDQEWLDNTFPFLPADFNDAYFQCAPADQQTDHLRGGETVELLNLTPRGRLVFRIPEMELPVVFFRKHGERHECLAIADTLMLEPEANRFTITWRASLPLKKNMFEIQQVLVGTMSRAWWRARELGKTYYRSLGELARSKRRETREEMA